MNEEILMRNTKSEGVSFTLLIAIDSEFEKIKYLFVNNCQRKWKNVDDTMGKVYYILKNISFLRS